MQKKFLPKQQKGVTLLELLLVLIIMAVIAFLAINRFRFYSREKDIAALRQNVDLLFQATNIYYHVCCSASQGLQSTPAYCHGPSPDKQFRVNRDVLKEMLKIQSLNQYLTKTSLVTAEDDYQVAAEQQKQKTIQTQKPIYLLLVSANLNVRKPPPPIDDLMKWYQRMLDASTSSTTPPELIWAKFPSYTLPSISSNLWIAEEGLRQFKESATQQSNKDDSCGY